MSGVAGCGGGDGTTDGEFVNWMQQNPDSAQYNTFNPNNVANNVNEVLFDPLAGFNQQTNEWDFLIADELNVGADAATLTLSEDWTWHDGEDLTADDIVTQFRIAEYAGNAVWDYLTGVSASGDYEVTFEIDGDVNQDILRNHILGTTISAPDGVFGEKLQAVEDAGEDEQDSVLAEEILEWGWEDPVGNGPFELADSITQRVELEGFDEHPAAGDLNFDTYRFEYLGTEEMPQAAISDQVVGASGANSVVTHRDQLSDNMEFVTYTGFDGDGHFFQFDDDLTGNQYFRKAYMHLIDQVEMNNTVRTPGTEEYNWLPHTLQTGMMEDQAEQYLDDDVRDGFEDYEGGAERAEELLLEGGFTKSGGNWQLPNGDAAELEIIVVEGNPSLTGQAGFVEEQMNDFGIPTNVRATEFSAYFDAYANGDFQVTIWLWGGGLPNPYFHFSSWLTDIGNSIGFPETVEVPMPVGDPDGSMEEVNPREILAEVGSSTDEEQTQELIQELAWIFNQTAPLLQGVDALWSALINRDGWNWPESDTDSMGVPSAPAWLPKTGNITAEE